MSRSLRTLVVACSLAASAVAATGAPSLAVKTRYVDDDGRAGSAGCQASATAFRSIQKAITASGRGDSVFVCPGTYYGRLTIAGPQRDDILLLSLKRGGAIVRPAVVAGAPIDLVTITGASHVRVQGFQLYAPTTGTCRRVAAMVHVKGDSSVADLYANRLAGLGANTIGPCGYDIGFLVNGASSARFAFNRITDFRTAGIQVDADALRATIISNTVRYLHAKETTSSVSSCGGEGITVTTGPGAEDPSVIRDNDIIGLASARASGAGTPLLCRGISGSDAEADGVSIRANLVRFASRGVVVSGEDPQVSQNTVVDSRATGILLQGVTDGAVEENQVHRSGANGIKLDAASSGVDVSDNDATGNTQTACVDESAGGGTAGSANSWKRNVADEDSPDGICPPPA